MTENIFFQISILFSVTISVAFLIRLLRQPLMVAYIVAGVVCGPLFLNLLHGDKVLFEAFSQFGIVLLLFVVGLNLNFNYIKKVGKIVVSAGISQVIITSAVGAAIVYFMGLNWVSALYLGVTITFSSTIVIIKLLNDKKDTESVYGRYTIGLMLVQDLVAIAILITLGILKQNVAVGEYLLELLIKGVVLFTAIILVAKYLLPRLLNRIASSSEFLFIFTITWCFAVASLVYGAGFSIEIGAIVAGLSLGSSPYQPEIASRIKPLRDFFLVLFFIILGSEVGLSNIANVFWPGLALAAFILIGNPLILYFLFRSARFTRRNSFLIGLTASQVSEFGFIVLFTGRQLGHLQGDEITIFTMVALATIFCSSYIITYNEQLYRFFMPFFRLFGKDQYRQIGKKVEEYDVWLFGYHRIGWKVCEALRAKKISFAVVDFNPEVVAKLKAKGADTFFGDAADVEFLELLPLAKAKMIIMTIPAPDDQQTLISHIRSQGSKAFIIANLYHYKYAEELYKAGADYVMLPHLLGGQWIEHFLKDKRHTARTFKLLRDEQKKEMGLAIHT
ncbi:MAG TPA: cation:proton antiporter [Patescibacteria group bacterium]|nr:cation:proton antiporter [Patescibacteria group bacterium]